MALLVTPIPAEPLLDLLRVIRLLVCLALVPLVLLLLLLVVLALGLLLLVLVVLVVVLARRCLRRRLLVEYLQGRVARLGVSDESNTTGRTTPSRHPTKK